jgi:hypothetical protein
VTRQLGGQLVALVGQLQALGLGCSAGNAGNE